MKPTLQLKLGQHLTMTPQLQQAIRLLQLSTLELQSEIQQTLEENPMLEQDEDNLESSVEAESQAEKQELENLNNVSEKNAENDDPHMDMENQQEMPDELAIDANWEDTYDITTATAPSSQSSNNSNNDFLENQSIEGNTLSEHLVWQLHNSQFSDNDHIIAIAMMTVT